MDLGCDGPGGWGTIVLMMNTAYRKIRRLAPLGAAGFAAAFLAGCGSGSTPSDSTASSSGSEGPAGYYEGETVTLIMGLDASAGGTTVGRLLAKHLELALEGNPTVKIGRAHV